MRRVSMAAGSLAATRSARRCRPTSSSPGRELSCRLRLSVERQGRSWPRQGERRTSRISRLDGTAGCDAPFGRRLSGRRSDDTQCDASGSMRPTVIGLSATGRPFRFWRSAGSGSRRTSQVDGHGRFDAPFTANARAQHGGNDESVVVGRNRSDGSRGRRGPLQTLSASNDVTPLLQASATVPTGFDTAHPRSIFPAYARLVARRRESSTMRSGTLNGTALRGNLAVGFSRCRRRE